MFYGTAQIQGNVCMCLQNACEMHLERVRDASGMHTRCIRASTKPLNKAAARLDITATPILPDTSPECMQDTCERYLGAELCCILI